jgi:hypothetical protein
MCGMLLFCSRKVYLLDMMESRDDPAHGVFSLAKRCVASGRTQSVRDGLTSTRAVPGNAGVPARASACPVHQRNGMLRLRLDGGVDVLVRDQSLLGAVRK